MIGWIRNNPLYAAIISPILLIAGVYIYTSVIPVGRIPHSQRSACINNLRQLREAKAQWALETKKTNGAPPVIYEINQYMKGGRPSCPQGGSYIYGNVGELPRCTYPAHARLLPPIQP